MAKITKATERSLHELATVLKQYAPHFHHWAQSSHGVLNPKEYQVILSYQKHQTHRLYADVHELNKRHVASVYITGVRKLRQLSSYNRYKKWLVYRKLHNANLAKAPYNLDTLVEPVAHWLLSTETAIDFFNKAVLGGSMDPAPVGSPRFMANLNKYSHYDIQNIRKANLCVHLYLTDEEF